MASASRRMGGNRNPRDGVSEMPQLAPGPISRAEDGIGPTMVSVEHTISLAPRLPSHRGAIPDTQCYDAAEETMATTTRRVATEEDLIAFPEDGPKDAL